nr:hypothetical protein [Thermaurantiacus tibetensis]
MGIEAEDADDDRGLVGVGDKPLLHLPAHLPVGRGLVAERGPRAVPPALLGIGAHDQLHLLGVDLRGILVDRGQDLEDEVRVRAGAEVLGHRLELDAVPGEPQLVGGELLGVAEEAGVAPHQHEVDPERARADLANHALQLRPAVGGAARTLLNERCDQLDPVGLGPGPDLLLLLGKRQLVVGLLPGRYAHIGGSPSSGQDAGGGGCHDRACACGEGLGHSNSSSMRCPRAAKTISTSSGVTGGSSGQPASARMPRPDRIVSDA